MKTRKRTLLELPIQSATQGRKRKLIKVELFFNAGGMNFSNYKNETKGLYILIKPVICENFDSYSTETSTAFSGVKYLVKPMGRFSQKQLHEFIPEGEQLLESIVHVIEKNSLQAIGADETTSNLSIVTQAVKSLIEPASLAA